MDIDGMGESWWNQLVDKGLVRERSDLYRLTAEQLMELERMGKKSAEKIVANIEALRSRGRCRAC